jgi:hypothetical protein
MTASLATPSPVVPAQAGTHNHRRWFGGTSFAVVSKERSQGMGPGLRRDDEDQH